MTTDPLHSLSYISLPAPFGAIDLPPCICLRDVLRNCGGRTVGRGRVPSGRRVLPLPVVVAVALLVITVLAVVVVPAFGGLIGSGSVGVSGLCW